MTAPAKPPVVRELNFIEQGQKALDDMRQELAELRSRPTREAYESDQADLIKIATVAQSLRAQLAASEAERERLREALEDIAADENVYLGHGDFTTEPRHSANSAQEVARKALAPAAGSEKA